MPMFVGSQSFISLPSFMFVSAVVSEIRELKEKEKKEKKKNNSEIDYFQFNTFPGASNLPIFFNQRYLLSATPCTHVYTYHITAIHTHMYKNTNMHT